MLRDSATCALLIPSKAPAERNQTKPHPDKMKTLNSTLTALAGTKNGAARLTANVKARIAARPLTQLGDRCRKCGFATGQFGCPECEHIALQQI